MKKVIKKDGTVVLAMSKGEWEKIGKDKGWYPGQPELEKNAQASTATVAPAAPSSDQVPAEPEEAPETIVVCKVCSYANRPEAFGAGACPKCGSTFLDR